MERHVISDMLPNLKFRQAVAAGKAFKSTVPMIFEVPEITENEITQTRTQLKKETPII